MGPRRPAWRTGVVLGVVCTVLAGACTGGEGPGGEGTDGGSSAGDEVAAPVLEEGYESDVYADDDHWICHGDDDTDLCAEDLDATVITAEGVGDVEVFEPASDPAVDCFYVYPTISGDDSPNSDLDWSPDEEGFATLNQAARLGGVCRVFAPAYRQVTAAALTGTVAGEEIDAAEAAEVAYGDVVDAWKHYLANDNDGRGVVLVGHSQGSGMLGRLLTEEIDPSEDARARLVGAYLAGWPPPAFAGGDSVELDHIGLCADADQTGCIFTWASFPADAPPIDSTPFGRVDSGAITGGCVLPAAPEGGPATLTAYLPDVAAVVLGDLAAGVETPFVALTDVIEAECVVTDDFHYLAVTLHDAEPLAAFITSDSPGWGLHTVDVSLVLGDMIDRIATQADAHIAAAGAGS